MSPFRAPCEFRWHLSICQREHGNVILLFPFLASQQILEQQSATAASRCQWVAVGGSMDFGPVPWLWCSFMVLTPGPVSASNGCIQPISEPGKSFADRHLIAVGSLKT
jgi:hypothetical protein